MLIGLAYATTLALTSMTIGGCDAVCFAHIGPRFLYNDPAASVGADGQFAYFIATDPTNAPAYLDSPAYRYQRILYPFIARLLAQARTEWVPSALIIVNILGIAMGTAAFAGLLSQENAPVWTPLLFLAWIGIGQSLLFDLNEVTALSLSLWAIVLLFKRRFYCAGVLFGLAALGKDLAFLFSIPVLMHLIIARSWKSALQVGVLSLVPYLIWLLVLRVVLGAWSFQATATHFELVPFAGLRGGDATIPFVVILLIIPGAVCAALALRHMGDIYALSTLACFAFLAFLPVLLLPSVCCVPAEYSTRPGRGTTLSPFAPSNIVAVF